MPIVYALKNEDGKYLRQDDNVGELSSSTKLYKTRRTAEKRVRDIHTYSRLAVWILYKKTKERVNIGSQEFQELTMDLKFNHPFEIVEIELKD